MIRIFGLVLMSGKRYDSYCEFVDRMVKGNWLAEQNNSLIRSITDLQQKLDYAISKHPNLVKDFESSGKRLKVI